MQSAAIRSSLELDAETLRGILADQRAVSNVLQVVVSPQSPPSRMSPVRESLARIANNKRRIEEQRVVNATVQDIRLIIDMASFRQKISSDLMMPRIYQELDPDSTAQAVLRKNNHINANISRAITDIKNSSSRTCGRRDLQASQARTSLLRASENSTTLDQKMQRAVGASQSTTAEKVPQFSDAPSPMGAQIAQLEQALTELREALSSPKMRPPL